MAQYLPPTDLKVDAPWFGQFLLEPLEAPVAVELPENWQRIELNHYRLDICPSVPWASATFKGRTVVVLGHAFCGWKRISPEEKALEIASAQWDKTRPILREISSLIGRFCIFISGHQALRIIPDPTVSFKVLTGWGNDKGFRAASEIKLLDATGQFHRNNQGAWGWGAAQKTFQTLTGWPLEETPLSGVKPIPANHLITDRFNLEPQRIFPFHKRQELSAEEVKVRMARNWSRAFLNARDAGYELWFPVTSGQDSRLIAAAAKSAFGEKNPRLYFIEKGEATPTGRVDRAHVDHLQQQGIDVAIHPVKTDEEIAALGYNPRRWHSFLGHLTHRLPVNNGLHFPARRLYLSGFTAEVFKDVIESDPVWNGISAARALRYPNHPIVTGFWTLWLRKFHKRAISMGYEPSEFLYWEARMVHFAANMIHLGNQAMPFASAFNGWTIYELGMALPKKDRDHHTSRFFQDCTKEWWPELATFPLNPDRRTRTIILLKKLGLYRFYRPIGQYHRWWKDGWQRRRHERRAGKGILK